jgi:CubicO group peptidase (beta-lactamase class C family)
MRSPIVVRMLRLSTALLLLALPRAGAQQSDTPPSRAVLVARLDSLARDFLTDAPATGATIAVIRGGDTLLLRGVGERDRERHLPAEPTTSYRIGSVTKQFTAAAVMQLVEQGKIGLGDPVTKYLPQYPQWSGVTIRRLLNHTSGIHSYTASPEWQKHWGEDLAPDKLVAFVAGDTLDFAPGTKYRYNNTGYVLLGMVIEAVTRRPYAEYVRDALFAPAGMRSASYCPSRPENDTYAAGYDLRRGALEPTRYLSMTHPYAAGALCMSVPDYLRWQTALTSGRVVRPASYALMTTPDTLIGGRKMTYGFGLVPGMLGTHRMVQHGGDVNGFSVQQAWFPDDSLRLVVFTNTLGSGPDRLATNLASAVFGLPLKSRLKLPPEVALAPSERAKYEGTYDITLPNDVVMPMRLFVDSAGLALQSPLSGQEKIPLRYIGADSFATPTDPSLRVTILFEGGRATKASLQQAGYTMGGLRRP